MRVQQRKHRGNAYSGHVILTLSEVGPWDRQSNCALEMNYMLSNHPLFCEGVATLLRQESAMEFVGRESDAERAVEQIRDLRPDVVIIDTSNTFAKPCSIVAKIFDEKLGARIVGLNLNDNTMCIYREEEKVVRGNAMSMWNKTSQISPAGKPGLFVQAAICRSR